MTTTPSDNLKPLRGSARGKVLKRIVLDRIQRGGFCVLADALADFNARYHEPMKDSNATATLAQPLRDGRIRRVAQGVYAGPAGNGDLLPLLEVVNKLAFEIYTVLDSNKDTAPVRTSTIPAMVKHRYERTITKDEMYSALRCLERQGILRWDKATAALSKMYTKPGELLGGHALDVRRSAQRQPLRREDGDVDALLHRFKERRTADDDVIEVDEKQVLREVEREDRLKIAPPAIDPFS